VAAQCASGGRRGGDSRVGECREWQQLVESMLTGVRVGLLWMDTTALQEQLRGTLQRALGVLCMVLEVACHERLLGTLSHLQGIVKALSAKPVSLALYTAFLRQLKDMQASQGEQLAEVETINVRRQSIAWPRMSDWHHI
jgi:hypothetical protein